MSCGSGDTKVCTGVSVVVVKYWIRRVWVCRVSECVKEEQGTLRWCSKTSIFKGGGFLSYSGGKCSWQKGVKNNI